ncbi:MAG TPA: UDP-N-acetylmuramoyl-tripeptide--D-alanyl-D-alanine ligase [Bryobacteraceae bacterium]|nr:UDP-N-acetylmuramoyl-tripeptide--D-alanyl-D-alanine ligase [Bryobacteraceae bacterium]
MIFSLPEIAATLRLPGDSYPRIPVTGWCVDTRTLAPGDLFFALRGPARDGHDFVPAAFAAGAAAAVVDRPMEAAGPALQVPDVLEALQELALWARGRWDGQVVAVTGSAGKTSTKEIIAALLETAMPVGKSAGNLNNHIGVPLSILRLPAQARVAVLELGMNHAGEIRRLAQVARPGVGVVTNVGHAHVEFFDSVDEVALAKRELIEALPADGVAVLNVDDPRVARFVEVHPGPTVTFGFSPQASVRAAEVELGPGGLRFRLEDGVWLDSPMRGRHNVLNLLAGIAVAGLFGIRPAAVVEAVRTLEAGSMRGRRLVHHGITVLDDCYNSNPEAARHMLELLRAEPARRRIAVMGEMLELGRWSEALHREAGRHAAACGIDLLIGVRGAAAFMVDEALRAGMPRGAARFFEEPSEAGRYARGEASEGDVILFKGSRGTHVEAALARFME